MLRSCACLLLVTAVPVVTAVPAVAAPTPLQAAIGNPGWLHLSANVRARIESIDDQIRPGFMANEDLFSLRSVIRAEIGDGPLHLVGEIWDSRSYTVRTGSAAGTGEVNVLEPVQVHAVADLGPVFGAGSGLVVTAGRMVLNLGSRRLIAADDYRNTTNGYTGLRADVSARPGAQATFIYVLPQQRLPNAFDDVRNNRFALDRESFDARLWGGIVSFDNVLGPVHADASLFHFGERDAPGRPTRDRDLTTIDARLLVEPVAGSFDGEIEAAWQWGHTRNGLAAALPMQVVTAGYVHVDAGYSFTGRWHPRLAAEFDFASGDRPGGRYTRFDTLFGMRRADFSPGALLGAMGRSNFVTPALRLEVAPSPRSDGHVLARAMWAASASDAFATSGVHDPTGRAGGFAGYEFDTRLRHWLVPARLRGEINADLFLRRGMLRRAPNAPAGATTAYFSAAVTAFF
ncbi:MAG: hypothetical protein RL480_1286 [Pseudomonadota bacterium]|jgi:hypothetical protein